MKITLDCKREQHAITENYREIDSCRSAVAELNSVSDIKNQNTVPGIYTPSKANGTSPAKDCNPLQTFNRLESKSGAGSQKSSMDPIRRERSTLNDVPCTSKSARGKITICRGFPSHEFLFSWV
ncbi:Uncharacterized protein APZ42_032133 [Daphnia magna]|uniref:Uncharacterized protein n=1 Tax=Daphnia magna TaxID=35525 RepID=A0A164M8S9_9CRUS|nr:Uncharacterized protein APZ42_032133 [Daphnia magna]